jgi:hypothetical protein
LRRALQKVPLRWRKRLEIFRDFEHIGHISVGFAQNCKNLGFQRVNEGWGFMGDDYSVVILGKKTLVFLNFTDR